MKNAGRIPVDKDLSDKMGFPKPNYLSNVLNGSNNIKQDKAQKFADIFGLTIPSDFSDFTGNNLVNHDSKEGILRMLEKSLDANIKHANANEKNADNLTLMVKVLTDKLNSSGIEKVSAPFQPGDAVQLNPVEQTDAFLGKRVDVLEKIVKELQRGIS